MTLLLRCGAVAFGRPPAARAGATTDERILPRLQGLCLGVASCHRGRSRFWSPYKSRRGDMDSGFRVGPRRGVSPASMTPEELAWCEEMRQFPGARAEG